MATTDADHHADIEAAALVQAPPERVFEFLSDLRNHWRLADRFVEVVTLEASDGVHADGGTVRVRGPLGIGRTATTRVAAIRAPRLMIGTAELAGGTRARVSWTLAGRLGATRVRLAAEIERAGGLDRVLLAVGGRWWLRRLFESTLARLGEELASQDGVPVPGARFGKSSNEGRAQAGAQARN
ncbi:MAG TPA: SRPBCC family protein [Thermoleophilaceae bacterium]